MVAQTMARCGQTKIADRGFSSGELIDRRAGLQGVGGKVGQIVPVITEHFENASTAAGAPPLLMAIPVATLGAGDSLRVDLYIKPDSDGPPVLYRKRGFPASKDDVNRLVAQGIRNLYLPVAHYAVYQDYLREHLESFVKDTSRPVTARFQFLGELACDVIRTSFESGKIERIVSETSHLAGEMADLVAEPTMVAFDMYAILRHDYSMFSHAFNVATYCLLLAKELGEEPHRLKELAIGGLLHDVGKLRIPSFILSKTTPLTPLEQKALRGHPQMGFERLLHRKDIVEKQLMMAYQHHERVDGKGYPVGIGAQEISPWARLCAVASTFENRTRTRPGRPAMPVREVLEQLDIQAGNALDKEMVKCWKSIIKPKH